MVAAAATAAAGAAAGGLDYWRVCCLAVALAGGLLVEPLEVAVLELSDRAVPLASGPREVVPAADCERPPVASERPSFRCARWSVASAIADWAGVEGIQGILDARSEGVVGSLEVGGVAILQCGRGSVRGGRDQEPQRACDERRSRSAPQDCSPRDALAGSGGRNLGDRLQRDLPACCPPGQRVEPARSGCPVAVHAST